MTKEERDRLRALVQRDPNKRPRADWLSIASLLTTLDEYEEENARLRGERENLLSCLTWARGRLKGAAAWTAYEESTIGAALQGKPRVKP